MRLPVLASVALLAALPAFAEEEVGEGLPAPSFSLRTLNPDAAGIAWVSLDRFAGDDPEDAGAKVVLISFFASWCEPCKREMPFLVQLDRMYRGQGLRVLGVNIDKEEAGIETAKKLIAAANVTYPVLSDRFNFLARRYLGESAPLPSVFLVRRDGAIARIERGYSKDVGALLLTSIQQELGLKVAPLVAGPVEPKAAKGAKSAAKAGARPAAKSTGKAEATAPGTSTPAATTAATPPKS